MDETALRFNPVDEYAPDNWFPLYLIKPKKKKKIQKEHKNFWKSAATDKKSMAAATMSILTMTSPFPKLREHCDVSKPTFFLQTAVICNVE